jgi:hypothetical protein
MPNLKSAFSSYQTLNRPSSEFEGSKPHGWIASTSPTVMNGTQMVTGPCLIKRMYFWNENDGPVSIFLHDGFGSGVSLTDLPKSIIYKVGQQSQLQIDVPAPGFVMSKGIWYRHGNKSNTSTARVHATIVYEELPQATVISEQGT